MADYNSLAALRGELTEDDPDRRAEAYSAVMEQDLQPSEVLASQPDEAVVQGLVDGGVIPEQRDADREPAHKQRAKMLDLLQTIADNTGGA